MSFLRKPEDNGEALPTPKVRANVSRVSREPEVPAWKEEGWRIHAQEGLLEMQCGDGEGLQAWDVEEELRRVWG